MHNIDDFKLDEINLLELAAVLNQIANFYDNGGFRVRRGAGGAVVVMLEHGEFHYVPCTTGIGYRAYTYIEELM